jgi:hypothetical protein
VYTLNYEKHELEEIIRYMTKHFARLLRRLEYYEQKEILDSEASVGESSLQGESSSKQKERE